MAWKDITKSIQSGVDAVVPNGKDSVSAKKSIINDVPFDSYQDNYADVGPDAGKDFSQTSSENDSSFTAAWKDISKSIKSGADAVASVARDSVSDKKSIVNDNDVDISTGAGDAGRDLTQASSANNSSKDLMAGFQQYMDKIKDAWPFNKESSEVSLDDNNSGKSSFLHEHGLIPPDVKKEERGTNISEAFNDAVNGTGTLADAVKAAKESQVQGEPGTLDAIKERIGSVGAIMKDKAVNTMDSVKEHVNRTVDFAPEESIDDSDSGYDLG